MTCERCGREGLTPGQSDQSARLLRRADTGYCANCALTEWLRTTPILHSLLEGLGPDVMLDPNVQAQVFRVMESGGAQAVPAEINWAAVVEHWGIPLGNKVKDRRKR